MRMGYACVHEYVYGCRCVCVQVCIALYVRMVVDLCVWTGVGSYTV